MHGHTVMNVYTTNFIHNWGYFVQDMKWRYDIMHGKSISMHEQ